MYIGSWLVDDLITFYLNTQTSSGSAQDADSLPTYRIYENETATPILNGTMSLLDGANTIGLYSEQFTASSGLGFEEGKSYGIHIQHVVNGVTGTSQRYFKTEVFDIRDSLNTIINTLDSINDRVTTTFARVSVLRPLNIANGIVQDPGTTNTQVNLNLVGFNDDEFKNFLIVFFDDDEGLYYARWIETYTAATSLATLDRSLPVILSTADSFYVYAIRRDMDAVKVNGTQLTGNGSTIPWGPQ